MFLCAAIDRYHTRVQCTTIGMSYHRSEFSHLLSVHRAGWCHATVQRPHCMMQRQISRLFTASRCSRSSPSARPRAPPAGCGTCCAGASPGHGRACHLDAPRCVLPGETLMKFDGAVQMTAPRTASVTGQSTCGSARSTRCWSSRPGRRWRGHPALTFAANHRDSHLCLHLCLRCRKRACGCRHAGRAR